MENIRDLLNDPVKLEQSLRAHWATLDPRGEGSIPGQAFPQYARETSMKFQIPMSPPTPQEIQYYKTIADPYNTGRLTYEGFKALIKCWVDKARNEGKL